MLTWLEARTLMARARNGRRKLAHETYLHQRYENTERGLLQRAFDVKFYGTTIVTLRGDGSYELNTGGFRTRGTARRIRQFAPVDLGITRGVWHIRHWADPVTPERMTRCRTCHGRGTVEPQPRRAPAATFQATPRAGRDPLMRLAFQRPDGSPDTETQRLEYTASLLSDFETAMQATEVRLRRLSVDDPWEVRPECPKCFGLGRRDYGSKRNPVVFQDGIRVDAAGEVVGAAGYRRLYDGPRLAADVHRETVSRMLDRYVIRYTSPEIRRLASGTGGRRCRVCDAVIARRRGGPAVEADHRHLARHVADGTTLYALMKEALLDRGYERPGREISRAGRDDYAADFIRTALRAYLEARLLDGAAAVQEVA